MKETNEFLDFLLDIFVAAAKSNEDGKIDITDFRFFTSVLSSSIPGVRGLALIKQEVFTPDFKKAATDRVFKRLSTELPGLKKELFAELAASIIDITVQSILTASVFKKLNKKSLELA